MNNARTQGSNPWGTKDETARLYFLAKNKPMALLAAYNGTLVRSRWDDCMDGEQVKAVARTLAIEVLKARPQLIPQIPDCLMHTHRLVKEIM